MSEFQKVKDPSQPYKIALGLVVVLLLALMFLKGSENRQVFLGAVDIPVNTACNVFTTGTNATVAQLAPSRSQALVRWITNGGPGPIYISVTSTAAQAVGFAIAGSSTYTMSQEDGNLLRGELFSTSAIAQVATIRVMSCP